MREINALVCVLILLQSLQTSNESCFTMSNDFLRRSMEYHCVNLSPSSGIAAEVNSTPTGYTTLFANMVHITDSSLPEVNNTTFIGLDIEKIVIEANIQIIEDRTFERTYFKTIDLDNNQIQQIKAGCFNSTELRDLSLSNNKLTAVMKKYFVGAFNLKTLKLQRNMIVDIEPYSFKDLQSLWGMDLSNNLLTYLPVDIFRTCKYLTELSLSSNRFKEFQNELFIENSLLEYLEVQNNYLKTFEAKNYPKSLQHVNLKNNRIINISASNMEKLNVLILDSNNLRNINNCFLNSPSLTRIHLNHNPVGGSLSSKTFNHLNKLVLLELDDTGISSFHMSYIQEMKSLLALSLAGNDFTYVDFGNISVELKHLNLSSNNLQEIRGLGTLKYLESLDLSYNIINKIGFNTFELLDNLNDLFLSHNSINELEKGCFKNLRNLSVLDLSYNKIESIPNGVLNGLYQLENLNIRNNKLNQLDEDIFHSTKKLKCLNVSYNNLSELNMKYILGHTIWLKEIDVKGNNWTCKDLIAILRDYRSVILTPGDLFNVSNVNGISCSDTDRNEPNSVRKIASNELGSKLNTIIILLVLVLLAVCVKLLYDNYFDRITSLSQFFYRRTNDEQEFPLS